ncbi:MAG: hypothetical protein WC308_04410 [archaeon]|jgi:hypothetical protein
MKQNKAYRKAHRLGAWGKIALAQRKQRSEIPEARMKYNRHVERVRDIRKRLSVATNKEERLALLQDLINERTSAKKDLTEYTGKDALSELDLERELIDVNRRHITFFETELKKKNLSSGQRKLYEFELEEAKRKLKDGTYNFKGSMKEQIKNAGAKSRTRLP